MGHRGRGDVGVQSHELTGLELRACRLHATLVPPPRSVDPTAAQGAGMRRNVLKVSLPVNALDREHLLLIITAITIEVITPSKIKLVILCRAWQEHGGSSPLTGPAAAGRKQGACCCKRHALTQQSCMQMMHGCQ